MIEKEYLASRVAQASPAQLVEIIYEGLIGTINEGIVGIEKEEDERLRRAVYKSREILAELLSTVEGQAEMAQNLRNIYVFLNKLITEAELKKDIERLQKAIKIIMPLYEAWKELGANGEAFKNDSKAPAIVAGVTYGKGQLKDYVMNDESRWEKG